jgi:hypothetical protein
MLISLFKLINDKSNRLAMTETLYNYLSINGQNIALENVFARSETDTAVFHQIMPDELFASSGNDNSKLRINPNLYRQNLYELAESLIRMTGLNNKSDLYLTRFLDVYEYLEI